MQNGKVFETKNFATQKKAFANFAKRCATLPHHTQKKPTKLAQNILILHFAYLTPCQLWSILFLWKFAFRNTTRSARLPCNKNE